MAYTAGNLVQISSHNGYGFYRYDSLDTVATVEAAGYFNNTDDTLRLGKGDIIHCFQWTTAVRTGTLAQHGMLAVTNLVANGAVNTASIAQAGQVVSSLA